jgi:uncharacterized protein (TIGR02271 family)
MTNTRTMTALFDTPAEAKRAVDELVKAGIPPAAVRLTPDSDVASPTNTSYDTSLDEKGFWASLGELFMPDDDRYTYAEAMHRGSIMVSVSVDDTHADRAEDILEQYGTVDVDQREANWRKEGWSGYPTGSSGATGPQPVTPAGSSFAPPAGAGTRERADGDQVLEEVEEEIRVGKRQINSGRVKVRSYVVETPVSEAVTLRSETVQVERRPVNRPTEVSRDAFKERTIEAVATSEEAVISKEARVTGEVLVRKDVSDRTETVTDTVRSTKVDVEDDRGTRKPAPETRR